VAEDGENYYSLRALHGLTYSFNENKLALDLRVAPELLPTTTIDLYAPRHQNVYNPHDFGAFLNYGIDYTHSAPEATTTISATQQVGVQRDNFLLISDSVYNHSQAGNKYLRLMSSVNIDNKTDLTRIVGGDSFSSSGDLGSILNLGGVSFSKVYRMNPYLITYPTISFTGAAALPSDAELYVNGMKLKSEKLPAGNFDFRNITAYTGAGFSEVVLRDPFGKEQRIAQPFYMTDQLLKKGLHDFNYSAGFIRNNFGQDSNSYGRFAFSGLHRIGLTDTLTVGGSVEGTTQVIAIGGQGALIFPKAGMVTASSGASLGGPGKSGIAGSAAYGYQSMEFNFRLALRGFSSDYTTAAAIPDSNRVRYEASAVVGYGTKILGSFSLGGSYVYKEVTGWRKDISANYSRNLSQQTSLFSTFSYGGETGNESRFFTGITWYPVTNTTVSLRYENSPGTKQETVEVQKNAPLGEGYGYHALVSSNNANAETVALDSSLQYNNQYGRYIGQYIAQNSRNGFLQTFHLFGAGSVLFVGDRIGFARPVGDSFALAKVGNLGGVKVYLSSQEMGTTNSRGELFIPDVVSYYDNIVSIKAGNIPLNYSLKTINSVVSPPFRSGSCIAFPVKKLQPVTGVLKAINGREMKPLEFAEMTIETDAGKVILPTGTGGEFYWEQGKGHTLLQDLQIGCSAITERVSPAIKPGRYQGTAISENATYRFEILIPPSDDLIIDIGQVVAEPAPEAVKEQSEKRGSGQEKMEGTTTPAPEAVPKVSTSLPEAIIKVPAPALPAPEAVAKWPYDAGSAKRN
jgi:outer membrane usher protein FimD/PapC